MDVIIHSGQMLTVAGRGPKCGAAQGDIGLIEKGAVAVRGDKIAAVGPAEEILSLAGTATRIVDARGQVILPGLVDAHTHVLYAGDRADEFERRLNGASYLEIMRSGGGIMSTVRATRAAPLAQIVEESRPRLYTMLEYGTTTVECKTGYGLETETEVKLLDAVASLRQELPLDLIPTFLGAHAVPDEFQGRVDEYINRVVDEMLPAIRTRYDSWGGGGGEPASPLFCDVFCDEGAFTLEQAQRILVRAKESDFSLKIHADEFANLGGARLAANLGAASADHLMVTPRDEMKEMARAGVIAVLLPGTTFGLGKFDFAAGRAFIEEQVPVALGSDLNPGTSWCGSMFLMIAIATRYEHLTPAEALVAATLNAAYACGVGEKVGSLEPGKQADIVVADVPDYRHLAYRYGDNPVRMVIKRGQVVVERPG